MNNPVLEKLASDPCPKCGGRVLVAPTSESYEKDGVRVTISGVLAAVCENGDGTYLPAGISQAVVDAARALLNVAKLNGQTVEQLAGTIDPAQMAASEFGRRGGQAISEQKARAVRENGKKGGRPRKAPAA